MKRLSHVLMIALVALPLIGCGDKGDKKSKVSVGRTSRGYSEVQTAGIRSLPAPGQQSTVSGKVWGSIYIDGYYVRSQQEFNWNVHDFVAATMDPAQLGDVSGQSNASTGIRFWGYAGTNTTINPNGSNNAQIIGTQSELRMVVWDSYAGYLDSQGELITEVPVHIRGNATGQVTGNSATIRFQDQYGWIELHGTINSQYFRGTIFFDNTNGWANYLGEFSVPTCAF
ncbi:MAG: hypothetical protein AB7N80_13965, partial [Bdellovibrionales bacterium]